MEITRRTDYAIRMIAALLQNDGKPLSVSAAAELQDVPYSFARSIQHDLMKSGIITTIRGAHGGMVLSVDSSELTLATLIEAVQGPLLMSVCLKEEGWCPRDDNCVFHQVWAGASSILTDYLSSVTMEELLQGKQPQLTQYEAKKQ